MPDTTETTRQGVPLDELGTSGLMRTGRRGLVIEEFLPELSGDRGMKVYREMADNDPIIGAVLYVIEMLIRNVTWRVEGGEDQHRELIESCLSDMSSTWTDVLSEVLSMLPYGYSWHEVVYKRRLGDSRDPTKRSRFNDGLFGWRKIPIRAQSTRQEWEFDEEGGVAAFVQCAPPTYETKSIPIERSLLFRVGIHKDNPEGRSILRNCYRPWYFKRRIEEIEAIGIERDLAGLPVIYRTAEMALKYDEQLKKIVRNVRRDEQEGLLLPLAYDANGKKMLEFELMGSPGSRQINISQVVDRYNKAMAMTCLADFLLLGQQAVGSFALSSDKTAMFATALGAILKSIADVFNRYAIPRLLLANGFKTEKIPELVPGDLESPDLIALGAYITALAGAGMPLFPDGKLEDHLRTLGNLPKKPEQEEGMMFTPPMPKQPSLQRFQPGTPPGELPNEGGR